MDLNHYLNKLEYKKILEMLSSFCCTFVGKEMSLALQPCFNHKKVEKLLSETSEASNLIIQKGSLPISEIANIYSSLKKLESGNSLTAKELLETAHIFKLSRELKNYFCEDKNFDISDYTILETYFSNLYNNIELENSILSVIIDENTLADTASSKLNSIRKGIRKTESDIKESLNRILHSSSYSKAIMEQIVTIRNDRYVIPIKEEYRSQINGFIHDISASGSTVFIEPIQVFELNNKIQSLKAEENAEIEHIFSLLSQKIMPYVRELSNNISLIGLLDFTFAKANLARQMDAICPILNSSKQIDIRKARHPLIPNSQVVPIDIKIGDNYTSLIITGPNTGGKTVTLKTCGLLCIMAYMGLFIPAENGSNIYVFDNVFADIGDEQSIQESLSTFSSHVTNIVSIINHATSNSLILIDELGSGTDPVEGSALAISILEYFHNLNAICLTTTHYSEIKNYALVTEGFENASSSFDIENLKPTYQLLIGVPGKSNAFAISKKLGLKEDILKRAKNLLEDDSINIEELLKNIYDDKITIEKEKEEIIKNNNQIELLRKNLEYEKNSIDEQKNDKVEKAKIEARNILFAAKSEANNVVRELNTMYDNLKDLENINLEKATDSEIANFVKIHFKKGTLKNANELRSKLNSAISNLSSNPKDENSEVAIHNIKKEDLKVGMKIKIANFPAHATIISLSGRKNQIQVQIGSAKMNVKTSDIEQIIADSTYSDSIKPVSAAKSYSNSSLKSMNISPEINVIGQNVEEACFTIDKYLDNCYLARLSTVRIVHGKGTGKLREGIHSFLKKHPHVKSFRLGTFGEGEMGVTVVEIK